MNYEKIGEFIALKRKEKGLTQKELAQFIGVTDKAVSKWERGLGCPDVSLLEILAEKLDISILELLKGRMIEGEVIPVTEANDYVLHAFKEGEGKYKKIYSNLLTVFILFLSCLLVILNIGHILYLNTSITYDFSYTDPIKNRLDEIKKNIDYIEQHPGIFKKEDHETLVHSLKETYEEIRGFKILSHNSKEKIKRKDIASFDRNYRLIFFKYPSRRILEEYEPNSIEHEELFHSSLELDQFITQALEENMAFSYEYRWFSIMDINSLYWEMEARVQMVEYSVEELYELTIQVMKVGEINE